MTQIARNLTDLNDGFLRGKRYLILDRDTKYSDAFRSVLVREGIQVIRLPPRSPNLNAFAERFVRSIKEECLSRMIFFVRIGIASARSGAVHGALPLRAQSSGPGKPTSAARIRHCPTPSSCSTPPAPRRNAQLLPSGRSLTNVDGFFGQFGHADVIVTGDRAMQNLKKYQEIRILSLRQFLDEISVPDL
jgi:transposase InsO family protein